jgi:hypothetical protein
MISARAPLFTNGRSYASVPIDLANPVRDRLTVHVPTRAALEDGPDSLLRRPVTRVPTNVIANMEFEFRPSD